MCVCVRVCMLWRVGLAECHAAGSYHRTNYVLSFALLRSLPLSSFFCLSVILFISLCSLLPFSLSDFNYAESVSLFSPDFATQLTPLGLSSLSSSLASNDTSHCYLTVPLFCQPLHPSHNHLLHTSSFESWHGCALLNVAWTVWFKCENTCVSASDVCSARYAMANLH